MDSVSQIPKPKDKEPASDQAAMKRAVRAEQDAFDSFSIRHNYGMMLKAAHDLIYYGSTASKATADSDRFFDDDGEVLEPEEFLAMPTRLLEAGQLILEQAQEVLGRMVVRNAQALDSRDQ